MRKLQENQVKMSVPILYQIVLEKIRSRSIANRIETETVRNILGVFFHFPRDRRTGIIQELQTMGLITLHNSKYIYINGGTQESDS